MRFHFLRPGIGQARNQQDTERDKGRNEQYHKGELILSTQGQHSSNDQWSKQRPELVQRFMDPKAPTIPHLLGGMRELDITRWVARRFADTLFPPSAYQTSLKYDKMPLL